MVTLSLITAQFVSESEKRLIGDAGDVSFTVTNGTEAMDVS